MRTHTLFLKQLSLYCKSTSLRLAPTHKEIRKITAIDAIVRAALTANALHSPGAGVGTGFVGTDVGVVVGVFIGAFVGVIGVGALVGASVAGGPPALRPPTGWPSPVTAGGRQEASTSNRASQLYPWTRGAQSISLRSQP